MKTGKNGEPGQFIRSSIFYVAAAVVFLAVHVAGGSSIVAKLLVRSHHGFRVFERAGIGEVRARREDIPPAGFTIFDAFSGRRRDLRGGAVGE